MPARTPSAQTHWETCSWAGTVADIGSSRNTEISLNRFRAPRMKTSQNFSPTLLVNQEVGRVTPCAPQFSNAKTARRGLPRPTAPSSSPSFLLSGALPATSILLLLLRASAHAQGG